MEERILDEEEGRTIRVRRTADGAIADVTDALAEEREQTEETEVVLDVPDGTDEYDEDLVGLTPEQLKKELERRERAAREAEEKRDELISEGEALMQENDFAGAETFFAQALVYDGGSELARRGLWRARTAEFTDAECFLDDETATEASQEEESVRAYLLERAGEELREARARREAEAAPLRATVTEKRDARRGAFRENRKYYLIRFCVAFAIALAAVIGAGVSAGFLTRTQDASPVVALCVSAGIALIALCVSLVFLRKLIVAGRLCRDNERLTATEEGARLYELEREIENLRLVLEGAHAEV